MDSNKKTSSNVKRKKKRRRKKSPVPAIVIIVIIVVCVLFGIRYVKNQVATLRNETNKLIQLDIDRGSVDTTIYCSGDYGLVEETMKDYISEYMQDLKTLRGFRNDSQLTAMLGEENLTADGPDFKNSLMLITEKENELGELIAHMKSMATEESILAAIEETGLNKFYKELYEEQMLQGLTLDYFYSDSAVDDAAMEIYNYLEAKEAVLTFLRENAQEWTLVDGVLQFKSSELLEKYKSLTSS